MKPSILHSCILAIAGLFLSPSANATLLVGWHDFDSTASNEAADFAATGFSGVVTKGGQQSITTGGSNDGSYGTLASSLPTNDGYARILNSNLTFSMTNSSSSAFQLSTLFFDAGLQSGTGTVTVKYQIDAGPYTTIQTVANNTAVGGAGTSANYGDFAFNLVGIPLLSIGQTINFVFTASPNARIDNVSISGISAIPEPASLMALGCVLGSGLLLRNRRRPSGLAAA